MNKANYSIDRFEYEIKSQRDEINEYKKKFNLSLEVGNKHYKENKTLLKSIDIDTLNELYMRGDLIEE